MTTSRGKKRRGVIKYDVSQVIAPPLRGAVTGRQFVLEIPPDPPVLWGEGKKVLAVAGEGTMIYAPQGVGKTSLAQQYVNAAVGIAPPELLGFPVTLVPGRMLYLALDRPPQIARSWRRMVSRDDADLLDERVKVWQGPLPFRLTHDEPDRLVKWAQDDLGVTGGIVVDSYKNLAPSLSDESTGALIDSVVQETLQAGVQWLGLHHTRKATSDNKRPDQLSDVYGSGWLTAGLGSVICLWGKAGDTTVEFTHMKPPADPVGPLTVLHDHALGRSRAVGTPPGASPREKLVLAEFARAGGVGSTLKLADLQRLGSEKATRTALSKLTEAGVLESSGFTTNKSWTLVTE